jgi:Membrane-associated phospholipid phosphatase
MTIVFDPCLDSVALASGAGAALAAELLLGGDAESFAKPDASSLSWPDSLACLPYDSTKSKLSLAATGASMLWPALFALSASSDELLPTAASCAEALAWTYAAKDCLKHFFPKARPYAFHADALSGELLDEAYESFPSGHTALAFCGATSFAVLAIELAPGAASTPWLVAGGYAAAVAAGALRVAAGEHFVTDVAAGALLGSAIGYAATASHIRAKDLGSQASGARASSTALFTGPSLTFRVSL